MNQDNNVYMLVHSVSERKDTLSFGGTRYGGLIITFVNMEDNKPRNISRWNAIDNYPSTRFFEDLQLTCQLDNDDTKIYAWNLEYKPFTVNLKKSELMTKTLRSFNRKMESLREREGETGSFATYVNRVARILKCEGIVIKTHGESLHYDDNAYREYSIGEIPRIIKNELIRELKALGHNADDIDYRAL